MSNIGKGKITTGRSIPKATAAKTTSPKSAAKTTAAKPKAKPTPKKQPLELDISDDDDEIDIDSIASASSNASKGKITTGRKAPIKKTPAKTTAKTSTKTLTKTPAKSKKIINNDVEDLDEDDDDTEEETKPAKKIGTTKAKVDNSAKTFVNLNYVPRKMMTGKNSYILVIVESPGKIPKLQSALGPKYQVVSSVGHIIDLPKKFGVDIDNDFDPEYHIITDKKNKYNDKTQVVKDLIIKAKGASKVIIASDLDREGEMIGWSYKMILCLGDDDYERITFNSCDKEVIQKAIKNPGKLDMAMVNAQKTRRILDRLVGYKISPGLNQVMGMMKLSAGRVQSVVVKLICEKEQEISKFFEGDNASFFRIVSDMMIENPHIDMKCELFTDLKQEDNDEEENENGDKDSAEEEDEDSDDNTTNKMTKAKINSYKVMNKLMDNISKSVFKVTEVTIRNSKRYPSAPYQTSSAQQDASTKLGFNVKRTMQSLQKLYEAGYTTYLRTDSTNLSAGALEQCKNYVKENYGDDYHVLKNYETKSEHAQEAHEAIRPVDINRKTVPIGGKIGADEQKMYQLVWKRTVASQMAPADVNTYNIDIGISREKNYMFKTSIEDIVFPGFLAVYSIGVHGQDFDNIDKKFKLVIPKQGQKVVANEVRGSEEYKKPPLRYTEAGLVGKMKKYSIGRPATVAESISTIQKKNYVKIDDINGVEKKSRTLTWNPTENDEIVIAEKSIFIGREKKKFMPTHLGTEVNNIMLRNFANIIDYKFTANLETELDNIANGKSDWVKCLSKFWKELEPLVKKLDTEKKVGRIVGENPETGYDVIASMGIYGPMLTMARSEKKSENATAPIKPPLTIEKITLAQALKILKYPKILGVHKKKNVEIKTGKHGFYVTCGDKASNLPENVDPDDVTLEDALGYIEDKQKQYEEKVDKYLCYRKEGNIEYIINHGKYGEGSRYLMIKDTSKKTAKPVFLSFPSDEGLEDIDVARIKELAEEAKAKRSQWKKNNTGAANAGGAGTGRGRGRGKKVANSPAKAATTRRVVKRS